MINTIEELQHLIKKRDGCTLKEAKFMIQDCIEALQEDMDSCGSIESAEQILQEYLGLEPDYLDILLLELR